MHIFVYFVYFSRGYKKCLRNYLSDNCEANGEEERGGKGSCATRSLLYIYTPVRVSHGEARSISVIYSPFTSPCPR